MPQQKMLCLVWDDEKVKGDGSDWEPYAHQKLKLWKKRPKIGWN